MDVILCVKMCGSEQRGTTGNQMFPLLTKVVILMVLLTELHFSQALKNEVCDIGCLRDTVTAHTDVLSDFPNYQKQTDTLQNDVTNLKDSLEGIKGNLSSLTEYQNMTVNLLNDVVELKTVSSSCLQRLDSLDTYQGTTDYLVDDVAQLKGSVEFLTKSLSYIESHKEKTDILHNDVINIKESLSNYSDTRDEAAHLRIDTLYKNFTLSENEIEIQFKKLHNLTEMQNETTEKVNKLEVSLEKLDSLSNALHAIRTEQQIMKKKLEELSDEFQQLLKPQATPPVIQRVQPATTQSTPTIQTTTPTTQRHNSERRVIRKHAYARGNNITIII
jgi:chromosome segregation ATPase